MSEDIEALQPSVEFLKNEMSHGLEDEATRSQPVSVHAPKGDEAVSQQLGAQEEKAEREEHGAQKAKAEREQHAEEEQQAHDLKAPVITQKTAPEKTEGPQSATSTVETLLEKEWDREPAFPTAGFLLSGERQEDFAKLRAAILAAKKPADAIEEIFALEVAQLTWDGFRDARLSAHKFNARAFEKFASLCNYGTKDARVFWMQSPHAPKWAADALSKIGLSLDDILATTLAEHGEEFERMQRLHFGKLARRDTSLREFDRHREAIGRSVESSPDVNVKPRSSEEKP